MQRPSASYAVLVHAVALPAHVEAELRGDRVDELAHAVLHAGGDDVVLRPLLLQHQPLHLDVVARVAPVAQRVQVAEVDTLLQAELDAGQAAA